MGTVSSCSSSSSRQEPPLSLSLHPFALFHFYLRTRVAGCRLLSLSHSSRQCDTIQEYLLTRSVRSFVRSSLYVCVLLWILLIEIRGPVWFRYAEPSRAEQSRAEQSRAEHLFLFCSRPPYGRLFPFPFSVYSAR